MTELHISAASPPPATDIEFWRAIDGGSWRLCTKHGVVGRLLGYLESPTPAYDAARRSNQRHCDVCLPYGGWRKTWTTCVRKLVPDYELEDLTEEERAQLPYRVTPPQHL